jgi:hypothetical protein
MSQSDPAAPVPKQAGPPKPLALEYLGFRNAEGRREYRLCARQGAETREYTVWIAHTAFAAGHAQLQDGPDICYRKLWRLLLGDEPVDSGSVEVTAGELQEYRAARTPPPRGRAASKPDQPEASPWRSDARPAPRDRG